jgi:hypothetical protein
MPDQYTVPVFAPDGQMRSIPQALVPDALANGGQRAALMTDPHGVHRYIPEHLVGEAVKNGGRLYSPTADETMPKWYGFTPGNVLSNAWQGLKGTIKGAGEMGVDAARMFANGGPAGINPGAAADFTQKYITDPAQQQFDIARQYKARKDMGTAATVAGTGHVMAGLVPVLGPWAANIGEQAGTGDVGGAAGQVAGTVAGAKVLSSVPKIPAALNKVIPSTTRAGAGLSLLTERFGEHPIDPATAMQTVSRFERELEPTPSVKLPPIIRDFQGRMMEAQIPGRGLTFAEARSFLKRTNEQIGSHSGIEQNALKSFAQSLSEDIKTGVAQPSPVAPQGFAADYERMTSEYRKGSKAIRASEEAGPVIGAGVGYEVGRKAGAPIGGMLLGGMAGRILGKETIGRAGRTVIERSGGPPDLRQLPPIPRTPEEYTRTLLAAKEGELSAGEADRRITRGGGKVRVNPLPKPPE